VGVGTHPIRGVATLGLLGMAVPILSLALFAAVMCALSMATFGTFSTWRQMLARPVAAVCCHLFAFCIGAQGKRVLSAFMFTGCARPQLRQFLRGWHPPGSGERNVAARHNDGMVRVPSLISLSRQFQQTFKYFSFALQRVRFVKLDENLRAAVVLEQALHDADRIVHTLFDGIGFGRTF